MNRPCIRCGQLIPSGCYCPPCTPVRAQKPTRQDALGRNARWQRISKRLRALQQFCSYCGSTQQLSVDHRIPVSVKPEWIYEPANLAVACMPCQRTKSDKYTQEDYAAVEAAIKRGDKYADMRGSWMR